MKRFFALIVLSLYLVSARPRLQRYTAAFWGSFDTVVVITAYSASQRQFDVAFEAAVNSFSEADIYYDRFSYSEEIANMAYINRHAAERETAVDERLFSLLKYGIDGAYRTEGLVDMTFGAVSSVWYAEVEKGDFACVPPPDLLQKVNRHTGIENVLINEGDKTVKLLNDGVMIDAGAFAKGYAVEEAAEILVRSGHNRAAISGGGNIKTLDPPDGKQKWSIGIQHPDAAVMQADGSIETVYINGMSVATSGDYQRYFVSGGKRYHHLIDPETLYPADYFRSVTVVCENAADADLFSTALFLCDMEKGKAMAEKEKLAVLWVAHDGKTEINSRMKKLIEK